MDLDPLQPITDAVGPDATDALVKIIAIGAEHLRRRIGQDLEEGRLSESMLAANWGPALACGAKAVGNGDRSCGHPIGRRGIG